MAAFEKLDVKPGLQPMEAKLAEALPNGPGWRYEPKWDGFRCLIFRDGDEIALQSKSGKPLGRYFPEIVELVSGLQAERFVLDGELIIPMGDILSFDALQMRLHPAESRIRKLAVQTPAQIMLFDCLAAKANESLLDRPLSYRRERLEELHRRESSPSLHLSAWTDDHELAQSWLDSAGGALDGVVAKMSDGVYQPGERAMVKVKLMRTADCVVGGFRYAAAGGQVGSLLLGLYNDSGKLDHVGYTSSIPARDRPALTARLEALVGSPGFTGDSPGGPSRWSTDRSADWQPLRPELVAEIRYDHVTGGRFRHGTKFLRWRPDKAPHQCLKDQLQPEARPAELESILRARESGR
jgi:ATP-dependent DNA ligase